MYQTLDSEESRRSPLTDAEEEIHDDLLYCARDEIALTRVMYQGRPCALICYPEPRDDNTVDIYPVALLVDQQMLRDIEDFKDQTVILRPTVNSEGGRDAVPGH